METSSLDGIDALFVTNPTNIRYLTGFAGVSPAEREAYALVTKEQTYLFSNALYREEGNKLDIPFVEISREHPVSKELDAIASALHIRKLGFEGASLTVAELTKLKGALTGTELVPTRDRIEMQRMIKRADELDAIRQAAKVTDQCFTYITRRLRPGVTEAKIAWEIEGFLRFRGGGTAFSPIVAFNAHSSQPHYHAAGNDPLRKNSLILLDFGANVNGYCADMTRVVFLGTPNDEWVQAYTAVLDANNTALDLMDNGERNGATLDAAAREVIAEANLPVYPHSLGHAVGLDIHESPRLTVKHAETLEPGMVVTVEPGVYIEGSYGIRIEDLVRLTDEGIAVLSQSPKDKIIL